MSDSRPFIKFLINVFAKALRQLYEKYPEIANTELFVSGYVLPASVGQGRNGHYTFMHVWGETKEQDQTIAIPSAPLVAAGLNRPNEAVNVQILNFNGLFILEANRQLEGGFVGSTLRNMGRIANRLPQPLRHQTPSTARQPVAS